MNVTGMSVTFVTHPIDVYPTTHSKHMKIPYQRIAPLFLVLAALGAGCASAPAPAPVAPGAPVAEGQPATSAPMANTSCDNPYLPLKAGYKIAYKITGKGLQENSYTEAVKDAGADAISMEYTFSGATTTTMTQDLQCTSDGIKALNNVDIGSAMGDQKITTKTLSTSGQMLPAELSPGTEWDNGYDTETEFSGSMAQLMGTIQTNTKIHNKVLREEQVTVPAGSYTAEVVEKTITTTSTIKGKPTTNTLTSTDYWVKGVGLVKTISSGFTLEATSVTLP